MLFFKEKPKIKNDQLHKVNRVFLNSINIVLLTGFLITLGISIYATFSSLGFRLLNFDVFTSIEESYHPTSIPWIDNAYECHRTGRDWHEQECWDDEHNPMF